MMLLLYLVTFVAFMGLVRASPIPTIGEQDTEPENSRSMDCYTEGGAVYRHGQVFNPEKQRCIKYRCMFGYIDFYEEGCDALDQCWPINGTFKYQCREYRCEAYHYEGGRKKYVPNPIGEQMCPDVYGQCRLPGEIISYKMEGIVRQNCNCSIHDGSIFYQCFFYSLKLEDKQR